MDTFLVKFITADNKAGSWYSYSKFSAGDLHNLFRIFNKFAEREGIDYRFNLSVLEGRTSSLKVDYSVLTARNRAGE